jgi:putative PIG3 family NAD(P)H quinone oxidoreductase
MFAILVTPDRRLVASEIPKPDPAPGEVRLRVHATAVNRADLLQRLGQYPPPAGASPILGLEAAGVIDAVGPDVTGWSVGDRVCALLAGGGYAEFVTCPAGHVLAVPASLDLVHAAALPEVLATAWLNLFLEGGLQPGERAVIHAGGSGVGTAAIQLCCALGSPCFVTVGSPEKLERCLALGASAGAVRTAGRWADAASTWAPRGVDVILDPVGGSYLADDLSLLAVGGRLVLIGLMGGRHASIDLGRVLTRRLRLHGSVLRSRSHAEKTAIIAGVRRRVWPLLASGRVRPVLDRVLPITAVDEAFAALAADETFGKVVLQVL